MKTVPRLLAILLLVATGSTAQTVEFDILTLPGGAADGDFDLSYDGSRASLGVGDKVYLMDDAGNFTLIGDMRPYTLAGISGDGTAIINGTTGSEGRESAEVRYESSGWAPVAMAIPAGYLPCDNYQLAGYALNGNGSIATGLLWDGCTAKAFRWSPGLGMVDLGPTRGSAVSMDGTVIAGFETPQRRPAYWLIEGDGFTGPFNLHHPEDLGEVFDVSSNGQMLVGTGYPYGTDPSVTGYQAFIYAMGDTNMTMLGTLSGSTSDISKALFYGDNGIIIGVSGPTSINVQTFIWTPEFGMTSLRQYLIDAGVTEITSTTSLTWPRALSNDGSTLIGVWYDLWGSSGIYRVRFGAASDVPETRPTSARLNGVHPNPFNPSTAISFSVDRAQQVAIEIYDVSGRRVARLADREFSAGDHSLDWRGLDDAGRAVSSGAYLVRMRFADGSDSRTVSLLK